MSDRRGPAEIDPELTPWHRAAARLVAPRFSPPFPTRGRPAELRAHRAEVLDALRPRRVLAPPPDGDRLVGLLMVRSENDILDEHLRLATRFFDRILVLDGTPAGPERDECHAILDRYREVVHVTTDDALDGPVRDGARQVLLDEARRRYGVDQWIGILHADELHLRDPRPVLAATDPRLHTNLRVRLLHFFLHPERPDPPIGPTGDGHSVLDRVETFMWPGIPEARFFYDRGIRDYEPERHSKVTPATMRAGRLLDGYLLPQLNFRSPEQATARAGDRTTTGWQRAHYRAIAAGGSPVVAELELHAHPRAGGAPDPIFGRSRPVNLRTVPVGPRRVDEIVPVFVGGTGRCGSTAVKELLGRCDGAHALSLEAKVFSWRGGFLDLARAERRTSTRAIVRLRRRLLDLTPLDAAEDAGTLLHNWGHRLLDGHPAFPGYRAAVDLLLESLGSARLTPALRRAAVRDFVATTWEATVPSTARVWVEQTPSDTDVAVELLEVFPRAQVVYVRRHPFDIAASLIARPWGPRDVTEAAHHIIESDRRWRAQVARLGDGDVAGAGPRLHVVRFEDVVAKPSTGLRTVLDACGLELSSADDVLAPPARTPKRADDLPADDLAVLRRMLAPVCDDWGYERR